MLRTNLSTRPFYNERAVHAVLAVIAVLVVVVTVFNVLTIARLSERRTELLTAAQHAEARAAEQRRGAEKIRTSLDPQQVQKLTTEVTEANQIVDRRTFSWTQLFNRLETTLPDEVRIESITPFSDRDGHFSIGMILVARDAENIDAFIGKLEATGTFRDVLSREDHVLPDGMHQTVVEGQYTGPGAPSPTRGN